MGKRKRSGTPLPAERRVELPQAVWLLERMSAHDDPITREQVQRFGRNPDGPILPDACLESRRLPDGWGVHSDGYEDNVEPSIAMRADGVLAIAGVVRGISTVLVGDQRYEYPGRSGGSFLSHPEIFGFDRHGVPVVRIRYDEKFSLDAYLGPPPDHFRGLEQLDEHGWFVEKLSVLADGSVITMRYASDAAMRREVGCECRQVLRDGVVIAEIERRHQRFVLAGDGRIIGFWSSERTTGVSRKTETVAGSIGDEQPYIRDVQDCIVTPEGIRFIRRHVGRNGGFVLLEPTSLDAPVPSVQWPEGYLCTDRPYDANLQQFPDGRWVYESRTRRDARPCIVVGKDDEQPGFARVTRVFQDGDRWCYWAALGRHLYKMEIPPAEVAEAPAEGAAAPAPAADQS
ncbi:MAG: hypothetical protein Q8R16_02955 [bacterium]|nr:hypothetical protein [bacterium]